MRFLFSFLALVAVSSVAHAELLTASVGPITENPVPSWGNPLTDTCATVGSCDACQAEGPQYCYYKDSGDATCCQGTPTPTIGHEGEEPTTIIIGHEGEKPTHIIGHQGEEPSTEDADMEGGLVASVGPITENPVPVWGNPLTDTCATVGSCDACQPDGPQYCYYKDSGDATCCQGTPTTIGHQGEKPVVVVEPVIGHQGEKPIIDEPALACTRKRSCDLCAATATCKYTQSGIPQCCTLTSTATGTNDNDN